MPHTETITLPLFALFNTHHALQDLADTHACASIEDQAAKLADLINAVRPGTFDT